LLEKFILYIFSKQLNTKKGNHQWVAFLGRKRN